MLITISGTVGSGKSTVAMHVVEMLGAAGVSCRSMRFRAFVTPSLSTLFKRRNAAQAVESPQSRQRWTGFRPRRLTMATSVGYAARILAFRTLRPMVGGRRCHVLDRYFYDSFVHYDLMTRAERFYLIVLRWMIPIPDLAILLVASPETVAQRRPNYASEYILGAGRGYDALPAQFPGLVKLRTDPGEPLLPCLERLVHERLVGPRGRC
ncbi:MAG: hypothetical protein ACT4QD_14740 [Acidobacteriota bacterium]